MKRLLALCSVFVLLSCATGPSKEQQLVSKAVEALGGAQALADISTTSVQGQPQAVGARAVGRAGRRDALRQRSADRRHGRRAGARQPRRLGEELRLSGAAHLHLQRDRHADRRLRDRRRQQRPQRGEHEGESAGALDVGIPAGHRAARRAPRRRLQPPARDVLQPRAGATGRGHRGAGAGLSGGLLPGLHRRVRSPDRAAGARTHARLRQHLGRRDLRPGPQRLEGGRRASRWR